jgi:Alpha-glucosidases, family 31 of glycosyl hydrolases
MDRRLAQAKDGDALDEWQELNARWFQYSAFCPILRVHGTDRPREMWNIGDEQSAVYQTELKFDRLRYSLFPYLYSVAGAVTQDGSTLMRPLVMDFPGDAKARELTDEYMFGPAFLVNPVTEYKARSRQVYLPAGNDWYDFWTARAPPADRRSRPMPRSIGFLSTCVRDRSFPSVPTSSTSARSGTRRSRSTSTRARTDTSRCMKTTGTPTATSAANSRESRSIGTTRRGR